MQTSENNRIITFEEVEAHSSIDNCWTVVHGKVFDITSYMNKHPGGRIFLVKKAAGKDCTADFEAMFHSPRARNILNSLYIGDLAGAEKARQLGVNRLTTGTGPYGLQGYSGRGMEAFNRNTQSSGPYGLSSFNHTQISQAPQVPSFTKTYTSSSTTLNIGKSLETQKINNLKTNENQSVNNTNTNDNNTNDNNTNDNNTNDNNTIDNNTIDNNTIDNNTIDNNENQSKILESID
eukprot:TRINITY_DN2633_c0_g5_i1.p1 TRINITY_DN2633_c0_g5~~TRINITY_DN2633_c0_g5_i1.p1  ORF type:complete len:263 (-),score=117.44 TRINITY_DN2633_c0_g5_i1:220-924(-)